MKREELRKLVTESTQQVEFIKKDGTHRTMVCTLRPDIISQNYGGSYNAVEPSHLLTVWDVMVQGWRRVNLTTLISVKPYEM